MDPPNLAMATAAACSVFRGKEIRPLGFSRRWELIGERAVSEDGLGRLTPWWRRPGLGRATLGCGRLLAPVSSSVFVKLR
jgi:hypothetical protein